LELESWVTDNLKWIFWNTNGWIKELFEFLWLLLLLLLLLILGVKIITWRSLMAWFLALCRLMLFLFSDLLLLRIRFYTISHIVGLLFYTYKWLMFSSLNTILLNNEVILLNLVAWLSEMNLTLLVLNYFLLFVFGNRSGLFSL
jgi:hypothetical protein